MISLVTKKGIFENGDNDLLLHGEETFSEYQIPENKI